VVCELDVFPCRRLVRRGRPCVITSHHQRVYLADGDWIIPDGIDGTFYPCKPDIFEATYEPVAEAPRHDG